ncbi:MAG: hypothetical protein JNK72_06000 [Myxococcales bacterium]|nr:hypothetical protein [Myxococcales bacterium]
MNDLVRGWRPDRVAVLRAALLVLMALFVVFMRDAMSFEWPVVGRRALLDGTAPTPFQYRIGVVWLGRGLVALGLSPRAAFGCLDGLSVAALGLMFSRHVETLLESHSETIPRDAARRFSLVVLPLVLWVMPFSFAQLGEAMGQRRVIYLPWDLPEMACLFGCMMLLRAERWRAFYPAFVAATLVKESSAFLAVLWVVTRPSDTPPRRLLVPPTVMALAWVAVKLALAWHYRGHGEGLYEEHLDDNLRALASPAFAVRLLGVFGALWVPLLGGLSGLRDRFTRRAVWLCPLWFVAMLKVGNLNELRIFAGLFAVLAPAWVMLGVETLRKGGAKVA